MDTWELFLAADFTTSVFCMVSFVLVSIINVTPGCMFSFSSLLLAIVTFKPSIDITKEEFTSLTEFASRVDIGFDFTSFIATAHLEVKKAIVFVRNISRL